MRKIRKYITVLLCVCMTSYALPGFAGSNQSIVDADVTMVDLSDTEMSKLVGASGSVDANVSDYKVAGGTAKAVFANRSTLYCSYSLNATDVNGNVLEVLDSGTVAPGEAIVAIGTPVTSNSNVVTARIWNSGVPGLESKDFSLK